MRRLLCAVLLLSVSPVQAAPAVLASIRPLAMIAVAVTGDVTGVRQLVPDGASSHDYQLRPSDRAALDRASLVLWVGPAHERFLVAALAGSRGLALPAQRLPGIRALPQRSLDGAGIQSGTVDPHLWLDPDNAVVIARALGEALAHEDPAGAPRYRNNAAAFATRMAVFKARQAARFRGLRSRSYVAYHDAWQYLEPVLGLNYRGSLTADAESRPGVRHFLLMSERVHRERITCFLGEPGFDPALAHRVFDGTTASLVAVDELFVGVPMGTEAYEAGLGQMSDGIWRCLGGR